ncbi:MAG: divalent-cation tolerance protein CutA [Pyrinomonadaceae bacterium]|nr:divalent-cation tolerance protein CutA [Pyrinomonadaceae bacterium]
MLIVFTTCGSVDEADRLAKEAVSRKLAGCVQILPAVKSVYEWEGKIESDEECLLLIKTDAEHYPKLEEFINTEHSYETPEIAAVSASRVSDKYNKWLKEVLG